MDWAGVLLENARNPHVVLALAALLAWFVGILIHRIGRTLLLRLTVPLPLLHHTLAYIDRSASYVVPLLLVQIVFRAAPEDLRGVPMLQHLSAVLFILAVTWLLISAARGLADAVEARHPIDVADNLAARTIRTQTRVLTRAAMVVIVIVGFSAVLMSFPSVRTVGASLLASAGVIGLAIGMAAKPVLGNLIAGLQIALTQPIRIDDVLIIEGEWGRVEEITGSYVVLRIWDRRRLVIPLQWFIEHPFQNWTRNSADIIGTVFWWMDYGLPLEPIRAEVRRLCEQVPQWWDGELAIVQVVDTNDRSMQLRALVTARNSGDAWDLRCHVRAGIIDFIQREYPQYLPRLRTDFDAGPKLEPATV
ncbi:MAG TPA: mechanosensitive ion channel domain-containing protein [Rhodocyclaceae bacterium]|nr:mechanosensitive ion channel domain-containing protein [Rhodocyclaceae bacterium]